MTEGIGAITFYVTSGATPIVGAKAYMNSPGMPIWQYIYKGTTDQYGVLRLWDLPVGLNKYMISATGYKTVSGQTTVVEGHNIDININMVRTLSLATMAMAGSLTVTSNPSGACVYLNDVLQNMTTPVTIADLPDGDHSLVLTKDGYDDYITMVTITSGQVTTVSVNLARL